MQPESQEQVIARFLAEQYRPEDRIDSYVWDNGVLTVAVNKGNVGNGCIEERFALPLATIHLTLTGPDAGTPLCGIRKDTPATVFYHAMLWRKWNEPALCAACKALWQDDTDDDESAMM